MSRPLSADQALQSALNALALRQRIISNNVANVDTPSFKKSDVRFEEFLNAELRQDQSGLLLALARSNARHLDPFFSSGGALRSEVVTVPDAKLRSDGNSVDIDLEMLHLAETATTYSALSRLAGMRLALLKSAVTEGRR
ncbi:MAG: flagellar basal body rod protein FlgB [Chloroflexi bacterium]|nr:flagellar basal body rod protein FlgB [Chloroflexota bacterium]